MAIELKKISPVELRSVGLNEKWLQEQIKTDTTKGIDASSRGASRVTFSITNKAVDDHLGMIADELKKAEILSL